MTDEQRLTELLVALQENECVRARLTPVLRALAGAPVSDARCADLLRHALPQIAAHCGDRLSVPEHELLTEARQLATRYCTDARRVEPVRIVAPSV